MEDKARHLNFNKFVEDRSIEIAKFLVDLELDTKKKGHQALQRSVRRRAMSHNRFRIPRRLRKNMEEDLAKA
jgi:ribonuclease P/MRP protein subunit POP1